MIAIPEKIETRKTPLKGNLLKETEKNIRRFFNGDLLSLEDANRLYNDFFGRGMRGKFKTEKMDNAVKDFLFTNVSFDDWFSPLPTDSQKILYAVVFEKFVDVDVLEKILGIKINTVKERWNRVQLDRKYNLTIFSLLKNDEVYCISIKSLYRYALLPWFKPPPETLLENCLCSEAPGTVPYNNSEEIEEAVPLFCEALNEVLSEYLGDKNLSRSFAKKTVNGLYAASGFPRFPFETEKALASYSPVAADLLGHFLLFTADFRILTRPENAAKALSDFLKHFFGLEKPRDNDHRLWTMETMEFNMFFYHLNRTGLPTYSQKKIWEIFSLRDTLLELLLEIAEDGRTFDADALVRRLKYSGKPLSLFTDNEVGYLRIKADSIHIFEKEMTKNYWEHFYPENTLSFDFLEKPLFFGYLYLCASIGILEITQTPPPHVCIRGNKKSPISVFDSLKTVKITEFGIWCLGLSTEPPVMKKSNYEAISDNELLLVTVRGKSLERTIFLDRIGEKLGTDRWRINPSTFISGCENKRQIEDRVKRFRLLIDANPAPHWEKLFKTVIERAEFLDKQMIEAVIYKLPFDTPEKREASTELLADPELRGIAMRAEGGFLVVPALNQNRFYDLLAAHGISNFEISR